MIPTIQFLSSLLDVNFQSRRSCCQVAEKKRFILYVLRRVLEVPSADIASHLGCHEKSIRKSVLDVDYAILHDQFSRMEMVRLLSELALRFPWEEKFQNYRLPPSRNTEIAIQRLKEVREKANRLRKLIDYVTS